MKALTEDRIATTAALCRHFGVSRLHPDRRHLRPEVVHDLPTGGRRLVQRADGGLATMVSEETVYRDGKHTGALPGGLVHGAQVAPSPLNIPLTR